MTETIELEIHVESFSTREKYLITRLQEYRTIDADIRVQERLMNGIGLIHEPRVTAAAPINDYMRWLERVGYDLTEDERDLVETLKKHVSLADIATFDDDGHFRLIYASTDRIAKLISRRFSDDPEEDAKLQRAYELLLSKENELFLDLTETERIAEQRILERDKAKSRYDVLVNRKRIISDALADMERYYQEQYLILWHRYVLGEHWKRVCELASRKNSPLTVDEYRLSRKRAIRQFDKWANGI